jgi:hypothetical protein
VGECHLRCYIVRGMGGLSGYLSMTAISNFQGIDKHTSFENAVVETREYGWSAQEDILARLVEVQINSTCQSYFVNGMKFTKDVLHKRCYETTGS